MPVAVVTIVIGLALLIIAAGLFLRASRNSGPTGSAGSVGSVDAEEAVVGPEAAGTPAVSGDPAGPAGEPDAASDARPDVWPAAAPAEPPSPEPEPEPQPAPEPEPPARPVADPPGHGTPAGRRARRQWATAHGFEYTREDRYLTPEWPVSIVREVSPKRADPVARDLVSGFVDGHQAHIATVAGATLIALRRSAPSPVDVHFTTVAAMPAGMRHSELCDRPPFTGYSTDNRALDRMLDDRVTGTLRELAPHVSDVVFSGAWLVVRLSGRADTGVWELALPRLVLLADAARVLPPRVTSVELDMSAADPTRARPASGVRVDLVAAARDVAAEEPGDRSASRGHLRAVPDATPTPDPEETTEEATEEIPDEAPDEDAPVNVSRPTTPVDFPSRSEARNFGDTAGMTGASADLWNPDQTQEGIPGIGGDEPPRRAGRWSDPDGSGDAAPRIVRGYSEATIFDDGTDDGDGGWGDDVAEQDGPGRDGPALDAPRGRHRAPEARHSDPADDDDGDESDEVLDAEIVDPDD